MSAGLQRCASSKCGTLCSPAVVLPKVAWSLWLCGSHAATRLCIAAREDSRGRRRGFGTPQYGANSRHCLPLDTSAAVATSWALRRIAGVAATNQQQGTNGESIGGVDALDLHTTLMLAMPVYFVGG